MQLDPHTPRRILQRSIALLLLTCAVATLAFAQNRRPHVLEGERSAAYGLRKTWKPALFQGGHRKHDYYEGWYIKCVTSDGQHSFALIPGIALGNRQGEEAHAFIQYIDGQTAETHWYEFAASDFRYSQRRFAVHIADNYFAADSVHVDVGTGQDRLQVDLRMQDLHPWPVKAFSPGIMGPFRFVPGMETCHGLVSWDHRVDGQLRYGDQEIAVAAGRGYIEKDWGSSFPRSYVWLQTNRFPEADASFMCSIATIPYLGKYFTGFLGFFWCQGKLYRFATYTHARLQWSEFPENAVQFTIHERKWRLEVRASRTHSGVLKAPQKGQMERRISESVDAQIHLKLIDRKEKLLYEGTGTAAGMEIVGDRAELIGK